MQELTVFAERRMRSSRPAVMAAARVVNRWVWPSWVTRWSPVRSSRWYSIAVDLPTVPKVVRTRASTCGDRQRIGQTDQITPAARPMAAGNSVVPQGQAGRSNIERIQRRRDTRGPDASPSDIAGYGRLAGTGVGVAMCALDQGAVRERDTWR